MDFRPGVGGVPDVVNGDDAEARLSVATINKCSILHS